MANNYLTVTNFNNMIRDILIEHLNENINIKGEVSNLKISREHSYLTLKDNNSCLHAVLWNRRIDNIVDGDNVMVTGRIGFYMKGGSYQIMIKTIKKEGLGELHIAYEKIKEEYNKKGYFMQKREITKNIKNVGIITSFEGAAIHDILSVLDKNKFCGVVYIKNCQVQGEKCAESICSSIKYFIDNLPYLDVIILTRGGGSFEDLIGFSDVKVLDSIYNSSIPTISAIGHEIDFMLSDFVADKRAPTPSVAGEIISSIYNNNYEVLNKYKYEVNRLYGKIESMLSEYEQRILSFNEIIDLCTPIKLIDNHINKINDIFNRATWEINNRIQEYEQQINNVKIKLDNQNVYVLQNNGFVLITDMDNNIIKDMDLFKYNRKYRNKMNIHFIDGIYKL